MLKRTIKDSDYLVDGPDFFSEKINPLMDSLNQQISEIDKYPDKSLFFQNPKILEDWLALVQVLNKYDIYNEYSFSKQIDLTPETSLEYLLYVKEICYEFDQLCCKYSYEFDLLLEGYESIEENFISENATNLLSNHKYEYFTDELFNGQEKDEIISDLNEKSKKARVSMRAMISVIHDILDFVMSRGYEYIEKLNPSQQDLVRAINFDLREWFFAFKTDLLRDMNEELNRYYKAQRTDEDTPELWEELLKKDEEALLLAFKQELSECKDEKQEHWGKDKKTLMDKNGELMHEIYDACYTKELFNLEKIKNLNSILFKLTPDNIEIFYEIILRRSLIQCKMFPKLKQQFEAWLKEGEEHLQEEKQKLQPKAKATLSPDRQSKLDEIIKILKKGDWKKPATAENIEMLLNVVFGRDDSLFDEGDREDCEKLWNLIESGRGDRMVIVPANLAGFFAEKNLMTGSPQDISNTLFNNGKQRNNINKGKRNDIDNPLRDVKQFLTKYIDKLIRKK